MSAGTPGFCGIREAWLTPSGLPWSLMCPSPGFCLRGGPQEAEAGGREFRSILSYSGEFEASLDSKRACLKKSKLLQLASLRWERAYHTP